MIGYQMVGTNDLDKAVAFFEPIMKEFGAGRFLQEEGVFVAWAASADSPGFSVTKPHDGKAATIGNGSMTAFACENPAMVDKIYKMAIAQGGTCEGPNGDRGNGFYAGYFRDLDGNKFNAFCMVQS